MNAGGIDIVKGKKMYLMTAHQTILARDEAGFLVHTNNINQQGVQVIDVENAGACCIQGSDFRLVKTANGVSLVANDRYLCADPNIVRLQADRERVGAWETFIPVTPSQFSSCITLYASCSGEIERFARRVNELNEEKKPVLVYCGCGDIVHPGFLHIDIQMLCPRLAIDHPEDYFLFPFADSSWGVPPESIDYIFHEDFIEHIDQLHQIQFLSEAFRVLKRGAWHRINTPNIVSAMRENSSFEKGFEGVYTGERDLWGHIALLSPAYLKEIAKLIGYRKVVFSRKNRGRSRYAVSDLRPLSDRTCHDGNIFADLRK